MDNSNKDNQSTPDFMVISILYPNLILLLVYYADIRFSWFPLPELLMAFREPSLKPLQMLRTVIGAADSHLRGKGKITSTFNRFYDWNYDTEHPQQTIVFTKSQPRERTFMSYFAMTPFAGELVWGSLLWKWYQVSMSYTSKYWLLKSILFYF